MSQEPIKSSILLTEGGIGASHAEVEDFRPLVGPSTGGEFNTIKAALVPVACFRVDDIRFQFDSSFIQPGIEAELKHLAELLKKHPPASIAKTATPPETVGCPLSIFGHADPVGDDEYNKQLSGRRAMAVYGLLTRDVELWDELFKNPIGNDKWGKESIQTMVIETTVPKPTAEPDVSGIENNPGQRKALYLSYMDKLCEQVDETGKPKQDKADKPETLKLEKTDFLAQGQDKGGKGDYQGCGEFNPILLFSQEEEKAFQQDKDKTKRNEANAPNRRVMVLIFRKGTKVDPNRWPCPRAKEGTAGCKKRFWSDGEKRRTTKHPDKQRKFEDSRDTFACRFYDRVVENSPCERLVIRVALAIRLFNVFHQPIKNAQYVLVVGDQKFHGTTSDEGVFEEMVPADATHGELFLDNWKVGLSIMTLPPANSSSGVASRLENLGYSAVDVPSDLVTQNINDSVSQNGNTPGEQIEFAVARFKQAQKLPMGVGVDEDTISKIVEIYGS